MKKTTLLFVIAALAAPLAIASAQRGGDHREGGRRHGPPPEAFAACEQQDEGSLCEFETPRGSIEGVCRIPRGEDLVCVPREMDERHRQRS